MYKHLTHLISRQRGSKHASNKPRDFFDDVFNLDRRLRSTHSSLTLCRLSACTMADNLGEEGWYLVGGSEQPGPLDVCQHQCALLSHIAHGMSQQLYAGLRPQHGQPGL